MSLPATSPETMAAPPPNPSKQGFSVELYFDPALENQVLKAWNVLARRHISTQLIEIAARPHITLLSSPSIDPSRLLPAVRSLAARLEPIPISLSSVASFPAGGVLFLGPTPTAALLGLHSQLIEVLRKEGVEAAEEFRPDCWVPHCPVAVDVARSRMGEAFGVLKDLKLPVAGYAMDVGLVEFSPVREIFAVPLGGDGEA